MVFLYLRFIFGFKVVRGSRYFYLFLEEEKNFVCVESEEEFLEMFRKFYMLFVIIGFLGVSKRNFEF